MFLEPFLNSSFLHCADGEATAIKKYCCFERVESVCSCVQVSGTVHECQDPRSPSSTLHCGYSLVIANNLFMPV